MSNLVYLASPYTHELEDIRKERYEKVQYATIKLLHKGIFAFSPIAYNHPMLANHTLPTTWDFWEKYDRAFLEKCSELYILTLEGWDKSTGVAAEISIAKELNLPIKYVNIEEL